MLSAIIIDDNPDFLKLLSDLISENELPVQVIATAMNAADGFTIIRKHKPDIVFLDVEMPGKSGIDLAKDFSERDFEIIFTTSHDKYALEAIKEHAFDYLLKPVDSAELAKAIDKINKKNQEKPAFMNPGNQRMAVSSQDGIIFLDIKNIIRCEADNVYTTIFSENKLKTTSSKPLRDYEENLKQYGFIRVHKSHLINVNQIKKYNRGEPGYLLMNDESTIPVSKSGKDDLHKAINLS